MLGKSACHAGDIAQLIECSLDIHKALWCTPQHCVCVGGGGTRKNLAQSKKLLRSHLSADLVTV